MWESNRVFWLCMGCSVWLRFILTEPIFHKATRALGTTILHDISGKRDLLECLRKMLGMVQPVDYIRWANYSVVSSEGIFYSLNSNIPGKNAIWINCDLWWVQNRWLDMGSWSVLGFFCASMWRHRFRVWRRNTNWTNLTEIFMLAYADWAAPCVFLQR